MSRHAKVLIIGSGPAGYTAAVYAARALLDPVLIQGLQPGGQLTITTEVENWPGETMVMGPDLMVKMEAQARHVGTEIITDIVTRVDVSQRPFVLETDSGQGWTADTIVIATGAQARWLGLPNETKFRGFGVSACATCDGFFFRGKRVAVVGGGNTAVEEALYLANLASEVTLIHRRDSLRAEKILQKRLFAHPRVKVVWNAVVEEITASAAPVGVSGVALRDTVTGAATQLDLDGVFIAIGHSPTTEVFRGQVELDTEGYVLTPPGSTRTSVSGVFAAGDVQDKVWRQAVTAAGTGCMAALEVEKWLAEHAVESHAAGSDVEAPVPTLAGGR